MSTTTPREPDVADQRPPLALTLRSLPLRDDPRCRWGLVAFALALAIIVGMATASLLWALAAVACLALAAWRALVPVSYEVSSFGVTERFLGRARRFPWRSIGHWEVLRSGIIVTPQPRPAPIDRLRSLFIPWGDRKEEIVALFHFYAGTSRLADSSRRSTSPLPRSPAHESPEDQAGGAPGS